MNSEISDVTVNLPNPSTKAKTALLKSQLQQQTSGEAFCLQNTYHLVLKLVVQKEMRGNGLFAVSIHPDTNRTQSFAVCFPQTCFRGLYEIISKDPPLDHPFHESVKLWTVVPEQHKKNPNNFQSKIIEWLIFLST